MITDRWIPKKQKNPVKAIREMCIAGMGGGAPYGLIERCPSKECALYEFRLGKNPYRKPISEKRLASARASMKLLQLRRQ